MTGVELTLLFMTMGMVASCVWVRKYTRSTVVTALIVAAWLAAAYLAGLIG